MANSESIRRKVRRKVADSASVEIYRDEYYDDSIETAVQKLALDLGESFSHVDDAPDNLSHLIVLLASAEMCYIRAAEGLSGNSEEGSDREDSISSITVPDLAVSSPANSPDGGSKGWVELAKALLEEYADALEKAEDSFSGGAIAQGTFHRISRLTGGYAKKKLDRGFPPISGVSTSVSALKVRIRWTPIYEETFSNYYVYRSTTSAMDDKVKVASFTDNHISTYQDEVTAIGNYYYRVDVSNLNDRVTEGTPVIARVI